ncbi:MAG: TrkH family potassium uptake protein [Eggerthellaceae bacterium]|nr:TrkH family potassium uptake protein [Eggerthellaceae bacterium]
MWQRLSFYDVRVIGHYLGVLVLVTAVTLVAPLITAVLFSEWHAASRYLFTIGIFLVAGSALRFLRVQPGRLSRQQAFAVTGLAWLVLSFFAAIPLAMSGHYANYLDALFEAVSGFTTTGASVVRDLDHLAYADNMWRFMMHLTGGLGLVVVGLSFGLFGKGGASLFTSEGRSEHVVPNVVQTTQFIARITAVFIAISTIVVMTICLVIGITPARAFLQSLWVSISAFMTAGFVPMSQNIMYYHSIAIEIALVVVMLLGCINFTLHAEILHGRVRSFFEDMEIRSAMLWLVIIVAVFAASLSGSRLFSDLPAIVRRGLFMIFAAFTTTGFQNITTSQLTDSFSSGAFLILAILMAVGACSGSTTGGVKIQRFGILVKSIVATLKEALAPDSARVITTYQHIGRHPVTPALVREATTVLILYGVTYIIGTLAGIASGYEASQAIFESVAMASNGGITSGIVVPGMSWPLELFYLFEMWAGRLEFVTLLALVIQIVVSATPSDLVGRIHARREQRDRARR